MGAITSFFSSTAAGQTNQLGFYMNGGLSRATSGCLVTTYDITNNLVHPKLAAPVWSQNFTLGSVVTSPINLPAGLAALIEYNSDYGSDEEFGPSTRPRSRHRSRFYFGPWNTTAIDLTTANVTSAWKAGFVNDIKAAFTRLITPSGSSDIPSVVQWSPSGGWVKPISHSYLVTEPRYQRRRDDVGPKVTIT
jgi:hypothetical protein